MSKGNKIQYVQNEEPSFIRQFKQRAGVKDSESVQSKFEERELDDREDREDERPQVVIPEGSTVTEVEMKSFLENEVNKDKEEKDETAPVSVDGRILFRKPDQTNKRKSDPSGEKDNNKKSRDEIEKKARKTKEAPKRPAMLSFDADEEEDEES